MTEQIHEIYSRVETYANENQMPFTRKALPLICADMNIADKNPATQRRLEAELLHSLQVTEMLMELHPDISREEEDTLLAAALLHVYPESVILTDLKQKLTGELGFSARICEIVERVMQRQNQSDEEQRDYYEQIQQDHLALLLALADRGNIVQQLYRFPTWNAHRYIEETKAGYYPMCIYGKEHYHMLLAPISVLTEKMRTLVEVSEILLRRYEVREAELTQDILALREENATIKGIIRKFEKEKAKEQQETSEAEQC